MPSNAPAGGSGRRTIAAAIVVATLLVLPILLSGAVLGSDAPVHIRWQAGFAGEVWRGHPYPRWLPAMNDGFGSPAFFFYPPLLQWTAAAFAPLLPGPAAAMTRLLLAIVLLSVVGAAGCRAWLRALPVRPAAAFAGAMLFLLMPYRGFVDVYQRAAYAELAGICMMPWLFYGAVRLREGGAAAWGRYAIAVGVLLYAHLPAALIGLTLSTGYVVAQSRGRDVALLVRGAGATLIGAAMAAPAILPALGLIGDLTDTTAMFGSRNQPTNWLLFGTPWVDPTMHAMTLLLLTIDLALGAVVVAVLWRAGGAVGLRAHTGFLVAVLLLTALLNTVVSAPFWALQTPFSRIQFPFRLLSANVIALTGLVAVAVDRWAAAGDGRLARRASGLLLATMLAMDVALIGFQAWRNRAEQPRSVATILADPLDTSEYVLGDVGMLRARFGDARAIVLAGDARIALLATGGRATAFRTSASRASLVAVRQFAFTGWQCRIDGGAWHGAPRLPPPGDVAACRVPAGSHRLDVRLPATPFERIGGWLGIAGLCAALACLMVGRRDRDMAKAVDMPPAR